MKIEIVDGPASSGPSHLYPSTEAAKEVKEGQIKREAAERITALDWRLQRATEEELLGIVGVETKQAVLLERQAIREASSKAEDDMRKLTTIDDVVNFNW